MLVEAWRVAAFSVTVCGPEAAGVRRKHFIHQRQHPIFIEAELELGISDDDASRRSVCHSCAVQRDRGVAHLRRQLFTDDGFALLEGDVLVVITHGRFGGRREDRLRQLGRFFQASWQLDPAHGSTPLILLPA